jgi:hypothetical protein
MKAHLAMGFNWIVLAAVAALLFFLVLLGIGRRRGTRLNRLRVRLWNLCLGIAAGGGIIIAGSLGGCTGKKGAAADADGESAIAAQEADAEDTPAGEAVDDGEDVLTADAGDASEADADGKAQAADSNATPAPKKKKKGAKGKAAKGKDTKEPPIGILNSCYLFSE